MTPAQQRYQQSQMRAAQARGATASTQSRPGVGGGRTTTPTPPAPAGPTPPTIDPHFGGGQFTGSIIPNPNTGKKGYGSDTNPFSGIWNDPINGPGATRTIPLDANGHPLFTPPVGPPYDEGGVPSWQGHEQERRDSDIGQQMQTLGLDPLSQKDHWIFRVMYDPTTPASVLRQLKAAGVTVDASGAPIGTRHNISDLQPGIQDRYTGREGKKAWQNATVASANEGRNRDTFGGTGLQYHDPNIPAYGDPSWAERARRHQADWTAGGPPLPPDPSAGGPGFDPGTDTGGDTGGDTTSTTSSVTPPGGRGRNRGGTSTTQSFTGTPPLPPGGATPPLPPATPRAPIGPGGALSNPFAAGLNRVRGGVVYG